MAASHPSPQEPLTGINIFHEAVEREEERLEEERQEEKRQKKERQEEVRRKEWRLSLAAVDSDSAESDTDTLSPTDDDDYDSNLIRITASELAKPMLNEGGRRLVTKLWRLMTERVNQAVDEGILTKEEAKRYFRFSKKTGLIVFGDQEEPIGCEYDGWLAPVEPPEDKKLVWQAYLDHETSPKNTKASSTFKFWTHSRSLVILTLGGHDVICDDMWEAMFDDYASAIRAAFPVKMAKRLLELKFSGRLPQFPEPMAPEDRKSMAWLSGFHHDGGLDNNWGKLNKGMIKGSLMAMMGRARKDEVPAGIVMAMALLPDHQQAFLVQLGELENSASWQYKGVPSTVQSYLECVQSEAGASGEVLAADMSALYWDLEKSYGRYSLEPFFDPFLQRFLAEEGKRAGIEGKNSKGTATIEATPKANKRKRTASSAADEEEEE